MKKFFKPKSYVSIPLVLFVLVEALLSKEIISTLGGTGLG
jgi:hypothetical protein